MEFMEDNFLEENMDGHCERPEPRSLTPEEKQIRDDRYRFGGKRYGLRGPDHWGPDEIIPSLPSLYPMPADNNEDIP